MQLPAHAAKLGLIGLFKRPVIATAVSMMKPRRFSLEARANGTTSSVLASSSDMRRVLSSYAGQGDYHPTESIIRKIEARIAGIDEDGILLWATDGEEYYAHVGWLRHPISTYKTGQVLNFSIVGVAFPNASDLEIKPAETLQVGDSVSGIVMASARPPDLALNIGVHQYAYCWEEELVRSGRDRGALKGGDRVTGLRVKALHPRYVRVSPSEREGYNLNSLQLGQELHATVERVLPEHDAVLYDVDAQFPVVGLGCLGDLRKAPREYEPGEALIVKVAEITPDIGVGAGVGFQGVRVRDAGADGLAVFSRGKL